MTDHPRACGANGDGFFIEPVRFGSSPRMRGKPHVRSCPDSTSRIIPAHAGQTTAGPRAARCAADHPRACGANSPANPLSLSHSGSSPRMRGKPNCATPYPATHRIIPAHAGQTAVWRARRRRVSDHPRACGANSFSLSAFKSSIGSSPRMRGKLRRPLFSFRAHRIIPAHAGQTV